VKITAIRLRRLRLPLEPPFDPAWDPVPRRHFDATIVEVDTDEGLTGIGSGDTMAGFDGYEELFVGRDPLDLERHVRTLEQIAFHAGRYWPLEAALWDLVGKARGETVASLFGGAASRLPAYASSGSLKPPAERVESVLARREEGFRAVKIRVDPARLGEGLETVRAVRDAVGATMELMVDLNQAWRMPGDEAEPIDLATARRIADELRELDVFWLEEPLDGSDVPGLAELRAGSGVRIAGGEMTRTVPELRAYLEADALDVLQPDVVLAIGLDRARLIARLALERGRWFSPHTWTNGIGLVANLHVAAGVGGGPFLEFPYDPPGWTPERRDFMLAEAIHIDPDGYVNVQSGPGLGVELDPDALRRYALD
jgi:L-alanine-DL-glutamate epimerase-like enolase superfamily enzyme